MTVGTLLIVTALKQLTYIVMSRTTLAEPAVMNSIGDSGVKWKQIWYPNLARRVHRSQSISMLQEHTVKCTVQCMDFN